MSSTFSSIWVEVSTSHKDSVIFGGFYREWTSNGENSEESQLKRMSCLTEQISSASGKNPVILTGDANLCSLKWPDPDFLHKNVALLLKSSLEQEGLEITKTGPTYQADRLSPEGQVRQKILPGNSKTLWDVFKIAMDKECTNIPNIMHHGHDTFKGEEVPEVFSMFFKKKVSNIVQNATIDDNVFNGTGQINAENEFFMTELNIREVLSKLKIKNCEGIDRIPLRILNEGAEILIKPLSKLFKLIYANPAKLTLLVTG